MLPRVESSIAIVVLLAEHIPRGVEGLNTFYILTTIYKHLNMLTATDELSHQLMCIGKHH